MGRISDLDRVDSFSMTDDGLVLISRSGVKSEAIELRQVSSGIYSHMLGQTVNLTGDQLISGTKTFSDPVIFQSRVDIHEIHDVTETGNISGYKIIGKTGVFANKIGIGFTGDPQYNLHVKGDTLLSGNLYDASHPPSAGVDGYVLTAKPGGPQWLSSSINYGDLNFEPDAWYRMESDSVTTEEDYSKNRNDITWTNSPTKQVAGKRGKYAVELNGTNEYGRITNSTTFYGDGSDTMGEWSFCGWFYKDDWSTISSDEYIWDNSNKLGGSSTNYKGSYLRLIADGTVEAQFYNGTTDQTLASSTFNYNDFTNSTWHHFAIVLSNDSTNTTLKLYIDGTLEDTITTVGSDAERASVNEGHDYFSLGAKHDNDGNIDASSGPFFFGGRIDDVRIYKHSISQAEIQSLVLGDAVQPPTLPWVRADLETLTSNLTVTGINLQNQIDGNDTDIGNLTTNLTSTGINLQSQIDGLGGGTIDGGGAANYVPRWVDSDTLTDSNIYIGVNAGLGEMVGINQDNPQQVLDISGSILLGRNAIDGNSSSNITIEDSLYETVVIESQGNTGRMTLLKDGILGILLTADPSKDSYINAGNVGIGTQTPQVKLDVSGAGRFGTSVSEVVEIGGNSIKQLEDTADLSISAGIHAGELWLRGGSANGGFVHISDAGNNNILIVDTFSKKVGIGTTNPQYGNFNVTGSSYLENLYVTGAGGEWLRVSGSDGGGGSVQNLYQTIVGDAGTTTANSSTDSLDIKGVSGVSTSVTTDKVSVSLDGFDAQGIEPDAWYRMESSSATTEEDFSKNRNDIAWTNSPTKQVAGKRGKYAVELNGSNEYGRIANSTEFYGDGSSTMGKWSFCGWFYKDDWSTTFATEFLFDNGSYNDSQGARLYLGSVDGSLNYQFRRSGTDFVSTNEFDVNTLIDSTWHHIAMVLDNDGTDSTVKIYVDGVLEVTTTHSSEIGVAEGHDYFTLGQGHDNDGAIAGSDWHWTGKMDDIRIYKHAISQAEIQALVRGDAVQAPNPSLWTRTEDDDPLSHPIHYTGGHVLPAASGTQNLGSYSKPWASGFFKEDTIVFGRNKLSVTSSGLSITLDGESPTAVTSSADLNTLSGNLTATGINLQGQIDGLGGGTIDGEGVDNYVSKWSDANTLTTGLIWDQGNRVGIGTTTPTHRLSISGVTTENGQDGLNVGNFGYILNDDYGYGVMLLKPSGALQDGNEISLSSNGAGNAPSYIDAGNFGIGTQTPTGKLHVISSDDSIKDIFVVEDSTHFDETRFVINRSGQVGVKQPDPDYDVHVGTGASTSLVVTTGGLIGIGTENPSGLLHIDGTDHSPYSVGKSDGGMHDHLVVVEDSAHPDSSPFVIANNGYVGVGTTSPSAPLEVSATAGGLIIPRLDTTAMNDISSPTEGEMIYNTTANKFYGYNGTWVALH
jgi:hypothetical protein